MQVLLLLAAMIVARSQCVQWALQQRGQNENAVIAVDKDFKSTGDQKLLGFKHTPLYEWVPATRTSSVFSELLDNADDEEDASVRQQATAENSENEMLSRLLRLYDLLPAQTSKWRKRRRRQDEEVQPEKGNAGMQRQYHVAAPDFGDNSSSAGSHVENSISDAHVEIEPDIVPSHSDLHGRRTEDREKTTCSQQQSSCEGRMEKQTDCAQTEVGEDSHGYAFNKLRGSSWGNKRATPFSVVGRAWRRAFNSWGGKRNPAFHSWGGKRSNPFAVLGNSRSWGGGTDPSIGGVKEPAFTIVGRRGYPPDIPNITHEPAFTVLTSQTKPALSILRPKRDTTLSIWGGKGDPAFKILGNHDYPAFGIFGATSEAAPAYSKRYRAFGSWGGKRASVFSSWGGKKAFDLPDWEHQNNIFKRGPQFSSWGGKRYFDGDVQEKRGFSSWGGKRDLMSDDITEETDEMSKRRFSSWGGKREATRIEQNHKNTLSKDAKTSKGEDKERRDASTQTALTEAYQQLLENFDCMVGSRCGDNDRRKGNGEETERPERESSDPAVGNQNSQNSELQGQNAEHELLSTVMKRLDPTASGRTRVGKALFSPWGGKRSQVLPSLVTILGSMRKADGLINKRTSTQYASLGSKKWGPSPSGAVFSSWGGKRSEKLTGQNIHKVPPQSIGRQFRRGADFYSWGGKR